MDNRTKQSKKQKNNKSNYVRIMIGSGEDSIFVLKKKGERYMLSDDTFVIAGDTLEESRTRLEDRLDEAIYSKPVALVKKISKRIKKR